MPIFCVRWPNGDFSICEAKTNEDAAARFDEVGSVEARDVHRLPHFMIHLGLADDGRLEFNNLGEEIMFEVEEKHYPAIYKFNTEWLSEPEGDEPEAQAARKAYLEERKVAVAAERDRVEFGERELVKGGELVQSCSDASGAYIKAVMRSIKSMPK